MRLSRFHLHSAQIPVGGQMQSQCTFAWILNKRPGVEHLRGFRIAIRYGLMESARAARKPPFSRPLSTVNKVRVFCL